MGHLYVIENLIFISAEFPPTEQTRDGEIDDKGSTTCCIAYLRSIAIGGAGFLVLLAAVLVFRLKKTRQRRNGN